MPNIPERSIEAQGTHTGPISSQGGGELSPGALPRRRPRRLPFRLNAPTVSQLFVAFCRRHAAVMHSNARTFAWLFVHFSLVRTVFKTAAAKASKIGRPRFDGGLVVIDQTDADFRLIGNPRGAFAKD